MPLKITFSGTNKFIEYLYRADGTKLMKKVTDGTNIIPTDYLTGFQYVNNVLSFFSTSEGYVQNSVQRNGDNLLSYVYNHTDHLGNIRLSYSDKNKDGILADYWVKAPYCSVVSTYPGQNGCRWDFISETIEENNYYPFGLKHKGYNDNSYGTAYKYKYNGKEFQDELNLNVYDFSARVFDPASVVAWQHDPLSEQTHTPYSLFYGNPIRYTDPTGMSGTDWIKKGNTYIYDANINSKKDFENKRLDEKGYTYLGANKTETKTIDNTKITTKLSEDGSFKVTSTTIVNEVSSTKTTNGKLSFNSEFTTTGSLKNYGKTQSVATLTFNVVKNNNFENGNITVPIVSGVDLLKFKDVTSAKESYSKINLQGKIGIATSCPNCQDIVSMSSQGVGGGALNIARIIATEAAADVAHPTHLPDDIVLPGNPPKALQP